MGFLAPWFLAGLAAVALPVYIHLLRRQTTTPRPVSSLMFFERGTQSSTRHRRLRYLLLFALRALLVALLALVFANPFLRRSSAAASDRRGVSGAHRGLTSPGWMRRHGPHSIRLTRSAA